MRLGTRVLGLATLIVIAGARSGLADGGSAYSVAWSTVDAGGIMFVGGPNEYELSGTAGQYDAGSLSEDVYDFSGGFWANRCTCDRTPPELVHGAGMPGETRPNAGYVDPRAESSDGLSLDMGIDGVDLVFSGPVKPQNGADWGEVSFVVTATGGDAPTVETVDVSGNPWIRVNFAELPRPPLNEWTTVAAVVEDRCGNRIVNHGDLGPGQKEPDRIDFLFLPGDVDQNGVVGPFDLLKFRQIVNGVYIPALGVEADYVDIGRDGAVTPIDLLWFRQLINGQPPATRPWNGQAANHPQP